MKIKSVHFAFIAVIAVCMVANGEEIYKFNDTVSGTYKTITELRGYADTYLKTLDAQIAKKKAVSEDWRNPFRGVAKKRLDELNSDRTKFLDSKWRCPYWHWQKCAACDGTGTRWSFWTCKSCNGSRGHNEDTHGATEKKYACPTPTFRALLEVKE